MTITSFNTEAEQRFALAVEASLDGFWELDLGTDRVHYSAQWQRIAGFDADEITADLNHWLTRVHPEDRSRLLGELRALRLGKAQEIRNEHRMHDQQGRWHWVMVRALAGLNADGGVERIAGVLIDQTERRMVDPLTGLPNRLYFLDHLARRFEWARESGDWNFAALAIGVERFKLVNERLGYEGGDELLVEIALRLTSALGKGAVSAESIVARLNAADFLVCLDGVTDEARTADVAQLISDTVRRPFQWRGRRVTPAVCIGFAHADAAMKQPEELMRGADTALAEAKSAGRERLVGYSREMRERALTRAQMEVDLEYAIRTGQLTLHYQPEIDLASGRIIGFEALVRWQHPERGLLMPNDFIPLAEETGLILPLGDWGLREACRQIVTWREQMREQGAESLMDLKVSVNLSAKQFGRPGLVNRVAGVLASTSMVAADLRLEVTESSLMSHEHTAKDTMQGLRKLGVGLHMDDFGTGYSSLNHLHRYPFDTLKIDRSFVHRMGEARSGAEIVRTILELARSLSMEVVAEGIETAEQADRLKELGCRMGQGYFFGRPVAPEMITAMIASTQQKPVAGRFGLD